jgi:hypothetical protein
MQQPLLDLHSNEGLSLHQSQSGSPVNAWPSCKWVTLLTANSTVLRQMSDCVDTDHSAASWKTVTVFIPMTG